MNGGETHHLRQLQLIQLEHALISIVIMLSWIVARVTTVLVENTNYILVSNFRVVRHFLFTFR